MDFVTANERERYKRKIEDLEREKNSLIKENETLKRKCESYKETNKYLEVTNEYLLVDNNKCEEKMKASINSMVGLLEIIKQLAQQ